MNRLQMTSHGLSSGRKGAEAVRESFAECCNVMRRVGGPAYERNELLEQGASEEAILRKFQAQGIRRVNEELVAYWSLQNGTRDSSKVRLPLMVWHPTKVDDELALWKQNDLKRTKKIGREPLEPWEDPDWFRISVNLPYVVHPAAGRGFEVLQLDPESDQFGASPEYQLESVAVIFDVIIQAINSGFIVPARSARDPDLRGWMQTADYVTWNSFLAGSKII